MVTRTDLVETTTAAALSADLASPTRRWWDGAFAHTLEAVRARYGDSRLGTGESTFDHALSMAKGAVALGLDGESRAAGLMFAMADIAEPDAADVAQIMGIPDSSETTATRAQILQLIQGLARLKTLRPLIQAEAGMNLQTASAGSQAEILRKMLLAMASDIRVVLLRLISRTQSLRYFAARGDDPAVVNERAAMARETLAIYAPLANRLGIWQLKWEQEDLAFRFIEPDIYKRIARLLDEKRGEREAFMERVIGRLRSELDGYPELARAQVVGRPKHIYSIWNKMRSKGLTFEQLYDVRALRVIVPEVRDCYTALGIVHQIWQPIRGEFDDYISHPKGNDYRSLHTAVLADEGRSLEVQIRTEEMHRHAELGIAAHWRYKEAGHSAKAEGDYEEKIAWLRQLLSWREDITDAVTQTAADSVAGAAVHAAVDWASEFKRAALDDTLYVMTPEGRVIDLPKGATPIDFAYRVHTDLGHRCRGARVNGQMVPLATPLATGQRVDIVTAKSGGPSRDWLMPGYLVSHRARQKVKQWFAAQDVGEQLTQGRAIIQRELQRIGETQTNLELLASKLGLNSVDAMFVAAARGELTTRAVAMALRGQGEDVQEVPLHTVQPRADTRSGHILVVGVDNLLTHMGRCCKPIPPDAIIGFVTRGKGVSVHRLECRSFQHMAERSPERVISAQWGNLQPATGTVYAVDLRLEASDRHDLLRDVSEVLTRERVAVTTMKSHVRHGSMHMALTIEVQGAVSVQRIIGTLRDVRGVNEVRRV